MSSKQDKPTTLSESLTWTYTRNKDGTVSWFIAGSVEGAMRFHKSGSESNMRRAKACVLSEAVAFIATQHRLV